MPVVNYQGVLPLNAEQVRDWAILDTFDMLSPAYDNPQRERDVVKILEERGVDGIQRLPNPGLNLVGTKTS